MHAPVISGPVDLTHRELLDAALQKSRSEFELDRDVFVKVYLSEYKPKFKNFCRNSKLPPLVVAFCQSIINGTGPLTSSKI